jgi:hypothetical protein
MKFRNANSLQQLPLQMNISMKMVDPPFETIFLEMMMMIRRSK